MQFRILGPLEVAERDVTRPLGGAKQRAVLAILLLHRGEVLSAERLIEELWGEHAPATAAKVLQAYISRLRKAIGGDVLLTRGHGYVLSPAAGEVDLDEFERLAADGRAALAGGDAASAAARLREALGLWRGPPLSDFTYEAFAQGEIACLEEARMAALEARIDADLALGRHDRLVPELELLAREHPLRERLELRELHQAIVGQDQRLDLPGETQVRAFREARRSAAFVGRERELSELAGALHDAIGGQGRLFLLSGEPGIGKSRLAEELARHARVQGAHVLVGRCWEAGGAPAFWPWVQSLRSYLRVDDRDELVGELGPGAAEVAAILPELYELIPGLRQPATPESEGARFRLFHATAEFLQRASEKRTLVLILDDLHAADTPSLLLLQFLARELGSMHVLLLAAMRDVDPTPAEPLTAMLAEVAREPVTRRASLTGLAEDEVAEYVRLTAAEIASPELTSALYGETEGNPLFVSETVRLLALEGLPPQASGTPRLAIPPTISDVISRRLAHLSPTCWSATRFTTGSARRGGLGCTAAPGRRWRRCTPGIRARTWPSLRTTSSRRVGRVSRARRSSTRGARQSGRSAHSLTRRRSGSTRWRCKRTAGRNHLTRCSAASCCLRTAGCPRRRADTSGRHASRQRDLPARGRARPAHRRCGGARRAWLWRAILVQRQPGRSSASPAARGGAGGSGQRG